MKVHARAVLALVLLSATGPGLSAQGPKPQTAFNVGAGNTLFLAVTPDGKTLVSLSEDGGTVTLWDMATGKPRKTIKGLKPMAYTAVLSNDGKTVATPTGPRTQNLARADKGGAVPLWDAQTGKERTSLKEVGATLLYVEFSPDGKLLAGGEKDGRVRLWDAATGAVKAVLKGHAKEVIAVSFSADGKTLASGDADKPGRILIWDWAAGKKTGELQGHPEGVSILEFTDDGKTLISTGLDGTVKVWDVASGKGRTLFDGGKEAGPWAAISPSGRTAAWTTGRSPDAKEKKPDVVKVYNLVANKELAALKHADTVLFVAFVAGGRSLVTASKDGLVQVWDVAALREQKTK